MENIDAVFAKFRDFHVFACIVGKKTNPCSYIRIARVEV